MTNIIFSTHMEQLVKVGKKPASSPAALTKTNLADHPHTKTRTASKNFNDLLSQSQANTGQHGARDVKKEKLFADMKRKPAPMSGPKMTVKDDALSPLLCLVPVEEKVVPKSPTLSEESLLQDTKKIIAKTTPSLFGEGVKTAQLGDNSKLGTQLGKSDASGLSGAKYPNTSLSLEDGPAGDGEGATVDLTKPTLEGGAPVALTNLASKEPSTISEPSLFAQPTVVGTSTKNADSLDQPDLKGAAVKGAIEGNRKPNDRNSAVTDKDENAKLKITESPIQAPLKGAVAKNEAKGDINLNLNLNLNDKNSAYTEKDENTKLKNTDVSVATSTPLSQKNVVSKVDQATNSSAQAESPASSLNLGSMNASNLPNNISTVEVVQPMRSSITPDVGSSEWGKAIGQQLLKMSTQGHQTAELKINPEGLGPLRISLSMNEQQLQVSIVSEHSSVRAAVESAMPQLRETLAENGINLGQTSVSAEGQRQSDFLSNSNAQNEQKRRQENVAKIVTKILVNTDASAQAQTSRLGLHVLA
jgi:flagellar hook-length control protein FliK